YKMNIFCKETQAHLQLHPHLNETTEKGESPPLITPELWMRDCRSESPDSDRSASPPIPAQPPRAPKNPPPPPVTSHFRRRPPPRMRRHRQRPLAPPPLPPPPL
ncbi:hypothetical protein LSTR_LSTR016798, partial [Laodelphax striatellus]